MTLNLLTDTLDNVQYNSGENSITPTQALFLIIRT